MWADPVRAALATLPKPDLHLHLLGAMRPATIVDLARRRSAPILAAAERALAEGFRFADLPAFVAFFIGLFELVVEPDALYRVTAEALEDAAGAGVRHAELRVTPWSHLARGADEAAMFDAIAAARRDGERRLDVTSRLVLDIPRTLGVDVAQTTLAVALRRRAQGVVGLDLAGDETALAVTPHLAGVFAAATRAGLGVTAHAGEGAGSASVAAALDLLGVRRIGHGTRAVEDEALVARLVREGVVLEVCPSSNEALGVVPSVAAHPARRWLAAGVRWTVATDDPALLATDASREMARLHREAEIPLASLGRTAAWGFEAAFVEAGAAGRALAERLASLAAQARAWEPRGALPEGG